MENEKNFQNDGSKHSLAQIKNEEVGVSANLLEESPYEYVYGGDTYEDDWCS